MVPSGVRTAATATQLVRDLPLIRRMLQSGAVHITSHGRTEFVMLNPEDYARMAGADGRGGACLASQLSVVLDSIPTSVMFMDSELNVVRVNQALCEAFKFGSDEICGRNARLIGQTPGGKFLVDRIVEVNSSGQPDIMVVPSSARPGRTMRITIKPWSDGVILFADDITERARSRDKSVADHATDQSLGGVDGLGIAHVQSSGLILTASLGLARMTGTDPEALVGARIQSLFDPRERLLIDNALLETHAEPRRYDVTYLRNGVTVAPAALMVTPYLTAEHRDCAAIALHDPDWSGSEQAIPVDRGGPARKRRSRPELHTSF